MKEQDGFTVIEILIVIGIITLLAGVIMFNAFAAGAKSRDAERQADLKTLQAAVELYKQRNGRYPAGCRGPDVWSGQIEGGYPCNDGSAQYIVGLAPQFIPRLPVDPRLPSDGNGGYVYTVNTAGTVYKIEARRTVEAETVTYSHPLKSCDVDNTGEDLSDIRFYATAPLCNYVYSVSNKPSQCRENDSQIFQKTYAVWGGYAAGTISTPTRNSDIQYSSAVETQKIVCF